MFVVCCFMENARCFMSYPSVIQLLVLFLKIQFVCAVVGCVAVFALSFPNFSSRILATRGEKTLSNCVSYTGNIT